jgi:hypothetical protein
MSYDNDNEHETTTMIVAKGGTAVVVVALEFWSVVARGVEDIVVLN